MKSALFVFEILESGIKVISAYGHNTDYNLVENSFESCLKLGQVTHQTQSTDIHGRTFVTISILINSTNL